jgi:hypothetical protein
MWAELLRESPLLFRRQLPTAGNVPAQGMLAVTIALL